MNVIAHNLKSLIVTTALVIAAISHPVHPAVATSSPVLVHASTDAEASSSVSVQDSIDELNKENISAGATFLTSSGN